MMNFEQILNALRMMQPRTTITINGHKVTKLASGKFNVEGLLARNMCIDQTAEFIQHGA